MSIEPTLLGAPEINGDQDTGGKISKTIVSDGNNSDEENNNKKKTGKEMRSVWGKLATRKSVFRRSLI